MRNKRLDMGHLHEYRQWKKIAPNELSNYESVEVDADDFCIVVLRLGQPGANVDDSITANITCASCFQPREGRTITVYGEEGSLHYNWTLDSGKDAERKKAIVYRTAFDDGEWHGEQVPERFTEQLPKIGNDLHRDWAALAHAFVADIGGESHESYPTFRQGWVYQEIVEAVRSKDGWIDIPTDIAP
jgi:predicted dehydrogenase